jgi:glutathione S-transferase
MRKVRVALAEKGVDYELVPQLPFGPREEFRKKSPLGKIPCYEDAHPQPPLYPADPKQLGRALFYEEYADTRLMETVAPLFIQRFVNPRFFQKDPDEEVCRQKLEETGPVFGYLEGEVKGREYLAGGRFSVADIAVASMFVNFDYAGEQVDASRWPALAGYVGRIHARPSFKALIEEERRTSG